MARGVKRSIDDLIGEVDAKIKKKQDEISALKDRRKTLEDSRVSALAARVVKTAEEKGITVDELLASIKSK